LIVRGTVRLARLHVGRRSVLHAFEHDRAPLGAAGGGVEGSLMATATATATATLKSTSRRTAPTTTTHRQTLGRAIRSEWIKLRTLRST
jgi:hypothetical protein